MKRGDPAVYISLAGFPHEAKITMPRDDGTFDLTVHAGADHWLELSRIAIGQSPGTCQPKEKTT